MGSLDQRSAYVVSDEGICGGQPRIAGTRIKVQHIALEYERLGWSADQICDSHPGIKLAQIYAASSYYCEHRKKIDQDISEDMDMVKRLRSELT